VLKRDPMEGKSKIFSVVSHFRGEGNSLLSMDRFAAINKDQPISISS
jgi:hypothetical protein